MTSIVSTKDTNINMSTVPHCNMLQTKIRSPIIMLEAVVVYTLHLYWPKEKLVLHTL